jgi:uncharacterized protein YceK
MRILLVEALVLALSGCGTGVNLWLGVEPEHPRTSASHYAWGVDFGDTQIYGGIQNDVIGIGRAVRGEDGFWWSVISLPLLVLVDFPLSLVADTLTLPYTVPYVLTREDPKPSSP